MTTKKQTRSPKAKTSEVSDSPRETSPELKAMIRSLRRNMDLTGEEFGRRLGVKRARVSAWEQGEKPSAATLFELAGLAFHYEEANALDFYRHGGIDIDRLSDKLKGAFLVQRESASDPLDVFMLPVRESAKAIAVDESIHKIPVPATRIPNRESSFCVLIGAESTRGPFDQGGLVIIDGSRREILPADAKTRTLAVFFEELPHRETISRSMEREVSWSHEELLNYLAASYGEDGEPRQGPGVRFGIVHVHGTDTNKGGLWSLKLGQNGGPDGPLLSDWREGRWPSTVEEAHSALKKGIHVLGTVIGWFAPPNVERTQIWAEEDADVKH